MSRQRLAVLLCMALALVTVATSCAQPTPQVVEKEVTVVVEKEKQVVQTVVVEKEKLVEKPVVQTVVVEKEVTPVPTVEVTQYREAPQLAEMVARGELPPVEDRLPADPLVVEPLEEIGQYGGFWNFGQIGETAYPYWQTYDYEFFVRWDPQWSKVLPNLAASWSSSADASEWTFYFRKGLKWSDGAPFTADDVLFWYEDIASNTDITPAFPSTYMVEGEPVVVSKIDDYTVRFKFAAPYPLLLLRMAAMTGGHLYAPKHYLQQFHARYVDQAKLDNMARDAGFESWWQLFNDKNNIHTNVERPTMDAWQITVPSGEKTSKAERNPYYWKVDTEGNQLPYLDWVQWKAYGSRDALLLAALAGEIDIQHTYLRDSIENLALFEQNKDKGQFRIYYRREDKSNFAALFFNLAHRDPVKNEILNQKDFRIALSYATDREDVSQTVWRGLARPRQVAPWDEAAQYDVSTLAYQHLDYDPDKANDMLDELYPEKDSEGFRLGPDGNRISLVVLLDTRYPQNVDTMEIVKRNWEEVGIEIVLDVVAGDLNAERQTSGDFDIVCTRFTDCGGGFPLLQMRSWVPLTTGANGLPAAWGLWYESGGESGVEPPEAAKRCRELYEQALLEPDQERREALIQQIFDINAEEFWAMGIVGYPNSFGIVKNDMRNVPLEGPTGWTFPGPAPYNPCTFFRKTD